MKSLNRKLSFLTCVIILITCSFGVANASIDYFAQAKAEIDAAAQIAISDQVQSKTPFIGELYFDFVGANSTLENITINPSGYTTIMAIPKNTPAYVIYEGMYSSMMPVHESKGYYSVIGKNAIAQLDSSGNLMYGCKLDGNEPCISKLGLLD
ncbi:hypothetical protein [Psychrobacter immobilis]|uniref:hypothetical protein n=1 Tax=Psychrobacter immobilis TaxID=498 RepID=UPI00191B2DD3|nr:hypothetical protein [Psychrobacter immobilis]